ncbi:hypothetical protein [Marinospirillum sp.]|uniref:hypothetical protein n=1 Tax=Marinospirillum sp. TaxID=2183934 RepID=UPI0038504D22
MMQAIEFETDIKEGIVRIPAEYQHLKNAHAKIVVLFETTQVHEKVASHPAGKAVDFSCVEAPSMTPEDGVDFQRKLRDEW